MENQTARRVETTEPAYDPNYEQGGRVQATREPPTILELPKGISSAEDRLRDSLSRLSALNDQISGPVPQAAGKFGGDQVPSSSLLDDARGGLTRLHGVAIALEREVDRLARAVG